MPFENAKSNLEEFGKELNLDGLKFDKNNTCILGIDNTFSLHLTYEPHSDRLYLYSPILDGLPKDDKTKLKLYEALLEGAMLGGQMAGGGVGLAINEELIIMHCVLDMSYGTSNSSLRRFAAIFVELVEKWRKRAVNIIEGRDPGAVGIFGANANFLSDKFGGKPPHTKEEGHGGPPGDKFIKI